VDQKADRWSCTYRTASPASGVKSTPVRSASSNSNPNPGRVEGTSGKCRLQQSVCLGFPVCALGLHTMFVRPRPRQTGRADLPASTKIEKLTKRLRVRAPRIERSLRLCVAVTFMMHSEDFNDHTVLQIDLGKPSGHSAFNSSRRKHKVPVQNVLRITS
jgi:hypothetical protein